jgi:aminoglycoside phosphotransferase (APT) family kinase protein
VPSGRTTPSDDDPGPLIGTGRAADVFDIGGGRVLRRNRSGAPTDHEATVMQHLWRHDYPVPEVYDADGADIIMDRVDGPTMLEAFAGRPWMIRSWARLLASLHGRLADVPLPDLALPERFGAPEVLIHADLHPDNVMLTPAGPVVIDWTNASAGVRNAEVASTWLIVATSELDAGGLVGAMQRGVRSHFLSVFLDHTDRDAARAMLAVVAEHRLTDRNLRSGEAASIHQLLDDELVNFRA